MPTQQMDSRPLPRQLESLLSRLHATLKAHDLWEVLDSFPAVTSSSFQETTIHKQNGIRLRLGFREQADGVQASSWAYVLLDHSDLEPPVLIWDELPLVHVRPGLYKRAASSLLRVACDLLVPFRFLQFELHAAKNVRDMLCALVLYYSLANGLTDTAIKWGKFETSLIQALNYIKSSADYKRWRSHQVSTLDVRTHISAPAPIPSPKIVAPEDGIHNVLSGGLQKGGTVCSAGSSVSVKPGSNIAKLMKALGDRVNLLDAIPPTPISLDRQDLYPTYSPFRLYLGKYGDCKVYVYLTQDLKGSTKILAASGDEMLSWKFTDLTGLQLVEPFAYIMTLEQNLRTRGNKIRYLVYYYFMLAENAGLFGVPKTQTSFQSMIVPLCSACKDLEEAGFDVNAPLEESQSNGSSQDKDPDTINESLIVKLRVRMEVLAASDRTTLVNQRTGIVDIDDEEIESETALKNARLHQAVNAALEEREEVHETVEPRPPKVDMSRYHAFVEDAEDFESCAAALVRAHYRDSGFVSSYVSPASGPAAVEIAAGSPCTENTSGEPAEEPAQQKPSDVDNGDESRSIETPLPGALRTSSEKPDVFQRAISHLSHSNDGFIDAKETVDLELRSSGDMASRSRSRPAPFGGSHIIDLCSDDEDVATRAVSRRSVEVTPDVGAVLRPNRGSASESDNEELRWPSSRKRKRMPGNYISSDQDDEDFEEVDGGAWKRASLRQSQDEPMA